jgi:chromosome segregation ATPase
MVFRSIRLVNFVIHRDTTIPLDRSPITLITGSNGSGKTLILDALLLVIGLESKRAQRQRNIKFIGPFEKYAEVVLELNNPVISERRLLRSPDKEMNRLLDQDSVTIRLRILPSNTVSLWVNNQRTIRGRRISRQDVRQLFQAAGLFGDSPLAVTEAETLDQFASQTPRKKFETLLNETGLNDWMEKLEEARLLVVQARSNVTPLQQRIRGEEQRLQVLKTAFEAYEQKQKLQERFRALTVEAAWAEVVHREQLINQLETTITETKASLSTERTKMEDLDRRRTELSEKRRELFSQRATLRDTMTALRDRQMEARGKRSALDSELKEAISRISRYRSTQPDISQPPSLKEDTLRSELAELVAERDQLDKRQLALRQQIAILEEELTVEPQRHPRREEEILRACKQFRRELDATETGRQVLGPLFTLIRMKRGQEKYELAVKLALGRYAYAFLALNREAFRGAKEIFDRIWSDRKPNLLVARARTDQTEPRRRPSVSPPVHGWAADLIQGEPRVLMFLNRVINTAVAEAADPNQLADAAQSLRGHIITSDGASHYLRIGAFARPPAPVTVSLGGDLGGIRLGDDTSSVINKLAALRRQEQVLGLDRMKVNSDISQIQIRLQELRQTGTTQLPGDDRDILVADLQQHIDDVERQIAEIDNNLGDLDEEYRRSDTTLAKVIPRLNRVEDQLRRLDSRRYRLESEIERLTRELRDREEEQAHLVNQTKEQRQAAETQGPRPDTVRLPNQVREEQIQVQAMIETIRATSKDREAYEEQEKLVRQLQEYLAERKRHLDNLMGDVQRRIIEWRRRLEDTIESLNQRMNQLLSHFLKQVRLTVRHPNEPSRAELFIQMAINQEDAWRTYENMSGGERILGTQTFILALHTLAKSPLHVIDEFTQRLDEASRAAVLSVVQRALELSRSNLAVAPQFILMAPSTVGLEIPASMNHIVLIKGEVER